MSKHTNDNGTEVVDFSDANDYVIPDDMSVAQDGYVPMTDKEVKAEAAKIARRIVDDILVNVRLYAGEVYADNHDAIMGKLEIGEALEVIMDTQIDQKLVNRALRKAVKLRTLVEVSKGNFVLSDARKRIISIANRVKNPTLR